VSARGGNDRSPDLTEAVLGFRVWALRVDGGLGAMIAGSVWTAGVNEAVCSPDVIPSRRPKHTSPQPGCNCGFNAYFALNPRLRASESVALGAIAAWGEMDVYADGFRAQYAQVIALSAPAGKDGAGIGAVGIERLRRAAGRYGVPLVPTDQLRAEALRHASPLSGPMIPEREPPPARPARRRRPKRPAPAPAPKSPAPRPLRPAVSVASWKQARGHAIWVRRHVAVNAGADELRLGPAPGAAAIADPGADARVVPVGARVEAGSCVAVVAGAYPGAEMCLRTPVGGTVVAHNTDFARALVDGDRAVSSAPWLVALDPDDAPLEDAPLLWGRPGVELYRRGVSRQSDADVLAELDRPAGLDPAALQPLPATAVPSLAAHQRATSSRSPADGRRAAIMVEHLRPLLQACGEGGALLAA